MSFVFLNLLLDRKVFRIVTEIFFMLFWERTFLQTVKLKNALMERLFVQAMFKRQNYTQYYLLVS